MQQVVLAFVLIQHTASLRLYRDASFSLHIQLVQHLLVASSLDSARELQKPVAESALAMVNVRDNAEIAKPLNRDCGYSLFEFGLNLQWLNGAERRAQGEGTYVKCPMAERISISQLA